MFLFLPITIKNNVNNIVNDNNVINNIVNNNHHHVKLIVINLSSKTM